MATTETPKGGNRREPTHIEQVEQSINRLMIERDNAATAYYKAEKADNVATRARFRQYEGFDKAKTRQDMERMEKQYAKLLEDEKETYAERRRTLAKFEDAKTELRAATTYRTTLERWRDERDTKHEQHTAKQTEREQRNA